MNRWRRRLGVLALFVLLVILFLILLPIGVRIAAENYLESTGLQANIGDVDINLFTGTVGVTNAAAHTAAGDGFDIGHAEVNIDYLPLLSREIRLVRLAVADSSVDVRRAAKGHLRVGGFTVVPWDTRPGSNGSGDAGTSWGFGVQHVNLDGLTIHYLQPGAGDLPQIERRITLTSSSARDVNTWKPYEPAQVDADFSIGDSSARLQGQITAFGEGISLRLEIITSDFALEIVAPVARLFHVTRLAGRLGSDLLVTVSYSAEDGLDAAIDGHLQWQEPRIRTAGSFMATGRDWVWDGSLGVHLFQPGGTADRGPTGGKFSWDGRLGLSQPEDTIDGKRPGDGLLGRDPFQPQGTADRITTDGTLSLASIDFSIGNTLDGQQNALDWQGRTTLVLTAAPEIQAEGALSAGAGQLSLPAANIRISEQQLGWQGTAHYRGAGALHSEGQLTAQALDIVLGDNQLTITADAADFNGSFDLAPDDTGGALPVALNGDLDTAGLRIIDDALGRYIAASGRAAARDLSIDTVDDIRVQRLDVAALHVFERGADAPRRGEHAAVIRTASARAEQLLLQNLAALRIDNLDLSDAAIIATRTGDESDEIAAFLGTGDDETDEKQDDFDVHVVHTVVGDGSTLLFIDTIVEPTVALQFSQLRLELDDLNTDGSAEPARYALSTDIGTNGMLSSQGSFQVFGVSGPDASLQMSADSVYLPPFSGYVVATLNRAIARGNLDAELDLDIDDGELDGLLHVTLYNFALGEGYSERFQNALGISLDEAIALVRDSSGEIEFSTKILGNITEPWFSTANLFRQALYAGLKSAIFSFYSPLGWVEAAGDLIADLASGLDFEPVIFNAGKAALSADDKTYLSQLADSMEARPEPQIEVCGYAVPDDADARTLFGFGEVDADSRVDLKALAAKRRSVVVDYLASQGLDKGRLAPCQPEIDKDEGARPRVTLSF